VVVNFLALIQGCSVIFNPGMSLELPGQFPDADAKSRWNVLLLQ
jgi:hypothetical protein